VSTGPDFIVIGAMKCATSTLHAQLRRQPGIFMTTPKEPNFFSDDSVYERGFEWYLRLFEAAGPGDLCGEASTHYTKLATHPRTVERMAIHVPEIKLIYVMRHPVDRLVSHYIHAWSLCEIDDPIDEALSKHPELVDYGLYARQLRPYLETFSAGRILPVFLERLETHPGNEFERICRFIGYPRPPTWAPDDARANASAERLRLGPVAGWLIQQPLLRSIRRALIPGSARRRLRDRWRMKERPLLSVGARKSLEARFDADLAELGSWLGVRLCCSRFREIVQHASLEWVRDVPGGDAR